MAPRRGFTLQLLRRPGARAAARPATRSATEAASSWTGVINASSITQVPAQRAYRAIAGIGLLGETHGWVIGMRKVLPAVATIFWTTIVLTSASADQRPPQAQRNASNFCYCQCQTRENKRECMKMCELPKYEGRWWAVSCRKRPQMTPPKSPASRPEPAKKNQVEHARR